MLRDTARYTQNTLTYVCMILCTNNDIRLKNKVVYKYTDNIPMF